MSKKQILTEVRQYLTELENVKYKYGCVMLNFDISDKKWNEIQDLIDDEDISDGRETNAHITLLYGIHADVPDADVKKITDTFTPPEITFNKIGIFENDEFDVVKFDISDKSLSAMNKKLKELPHTSKFPDYKAHATIAFVKKGEGKKYVQTLPKNKEFTLKSDKILYSKPDGTKEEYSFKK